METKGTLVGFHPLFLIIKPNVPSKPSTHSLMFCVKKTMHLGKEKKK